MAKHLEQGEGGVHSSPKGDPKDAQGEGGAKKSSGIPQKGGKIPANVTTRTAKEGSHLVPHPAITEKTSQRGGDGLTGTDRTNPNLGKAKSGSKDDQQPGLQGRSNRNSKQYLK